MIIQLKDIHNNNENTTFYVSSDSYTEFPLVSLGKRSFIVDATVETMLNSESNSILIGAYTSIAHDVKFIINLNHDYKSVTTFPIYTLLNIEEKGRSPQKGQIIIGSDVWIGRGVTILAGASIGSGAVIGAQTVVASTIPPYAIAVGNPARIIGYRFPEEQIDKLKKINWWNWSEEKIQKNKEWFNKDIDLFINKFYPEYQQEKAKLTKINLQTNKNSILFIPDFQDKYPVWRRVLSAYTNYFTSEDDITLILRIKEDGKFNSRLNEILNILEENTSPPDILVVNDPLSHEETLLLNEVDYYVTTRNADTLKFVDYAFDLGIQVISGIDIPLNFREKFSISKSIYSKDSYCTDVNIQG